MTAARLAADVSGEQSVLRFSGPLTLSEVQHLSDALRAQRLAGPVTIDLAETSVLDTAGAWLVADTLRRFGGTVANATPPQQGLLDTITHALPQEGGRIRRPRIAHGLERLGRATVEGLAELARLVSFFGQIVAAALYTLLHPRRLRLTALVAHIGQAGLGAAPIVALMSFLIGIVLAYQGAQQLTQFGAEVFVVELVAVSLLRELAVLLTAILVAGRSASGFTAAIGSMKMREEIDAMRTIGLDPIELLVLPRVLAMIIFLPALAFIADISGLVGGALMAWAQLGVSPQVFETRLLDVDVSHFLIGMAKAPFFAAIIAVIGCYQGMLVEGNAESLGRMTSRAVVQAIFAVILVDALFSIFFAAAGL